MVVAVVGRGGRGVVVSAEDACDSGPPAIVVVVVVVVEEVVVVGMAAVVPGIEVRTIRGATDCDRSTVASVLNSSDLLTGLAKIRTAPDS
jgi:hypothetical protein